MQETIQERSQTKIKETVLQNSLCTGCGACVHLCPYFAHYRDHTVILNECDGTQGRCYTYCPRTPTDLAALQQNGFDPVDLTPELGAIKALYLTRATNETVRSAAQHGGTVTTLMHLALAEGLIDTAVLANQSENLLAESCAIGCSDDLTSQSKSKFIVAPTVATFNQTAQGSARAIGVVATPCQALALAKMRAYSVPQDKEKMAKLKLVIGLFCGWALSWERFKSILDQQFQSRKILKIDIPPSKHQCMEVTTDSGTVEIPLAMIETCVRDNCRYCFDMTCEFADLSVGSARSADGWAVDKGWNQVIVRTETGRQLMESARAKGLLEFKAVPTENLEKLKQASLNKKRNCLTHLIEKSGNRQQLTYLNATDPVVRFVLETMGSTR
ncbi:MAG: Coenzyme F420 hydrogenase/dehydrogenase, beta subunit C-terminal domain [Desulfobacterales bacterium]|jgi:coenzyme F420 hydrogenase subunit beta|nr:Coenzyme F420 hydrogenase/dehydrogenase, beta subunit C-terminal domain [Desulfobacterales bacterium]